MSEKWNTNTIALRMDPVMVEAGKAINDLMRLAIRRDLYPWEFPDRNPMPSLEWFPWIDRALFWRSEAPARLRGALDVLRDGVSDREDW